MSQPFTFRGRNFLICLCLAVFPADPALALPRVASKGFVAQDDGRLWKANGRRARTGAWVPWVTFSGAQWASLAGASTSYGVTDQGRLWKFPGGNPAQVGAATDWKSVHAADERWFAIKQDGSLWAAGSSYLGHPTISYSDSPIQIGTGGLWKSVAAGDFHNLAIRQDGSLWAWGHNSHGHLGNGTTTNSVTPVRVGTGNMWASATCAGHTSLALRTDGSLWVWGLNTDGLFGTGPGGPANSLVPSRVGTGNDWKHIASGSNYAIAIKEDGSLWSWGTNSVGQLGLGDILASNLPARVGTLNSWHAAVSSEGGVLAVRTDGSLWAWGGSYQSTVPVDITPSYTPIPVITVLLNGSVIGSGQRTISFATSIVGESTTQNITVRNDGLIPLAITEILTPSGFTVQSQTTAITPGQSASLQIQLDPQVPGAYSGAGRIFTNDPTLPEFQIDLVGETVSPANDTDGDGLNDAAEVALTSFGFNWKYSDPSRVQFLYSNAGLLGFYGTGEIQEIELRTTPPAINPAGPSLNIALELRNGRDFSPILLSPTGLLPISNEEAKLIFPPSPGRRLVLLKGVTPVGAPTP